MDQVEPEFAAGLEANLKRRKLLVTIGGVLALVALSTSAVLYFWNRQANLSEQEYLVRAQSSLRGGQIQTAVIELKNALQANPRNGKTRLDLAKLYLQLDMGHEAEEQLNRAKELGGEAKNLKLHLAEALILQRKYDKVLQEITLADYPQPDERHQATRLRADALLGLGKTEESCPLYLRLIEANPKHVPAYWGLMKCAVAGKDFKAARAHLDTALGLEPLNLRSLMLKGDLAQGMGDLVAAETAYGEALAANPNSIPARVARAAARLAAGKLDAAGEDVAVAKSKAPDILMVRYMDALLAYRQGRLADAHNILLGILGRAPDHLPSRLLSGNIAFQLGQYRLADKNLSAVIVWQPDNREARLALAQSRLKTAQPEGVLKALEPLLVRDTKDAEVLAIAGEAYLQQGNADKAAMFLDKAASLAPAQAAMRSKVGLWRLRAGDTAGAAKEFDAAAKLDVSPLQAESLRVMTHLMRREFSQALALAVALEKSHPNQAIPPHLVGMAQMAGGDSAKARASFERALALQPGNVSVARSLAQLDLLSRKPQGAEARYESVLRHDPQNYEALMELAQLAKNRKSDKDYVAWLAKAAAAAPGETPPRLYLARHYLARNEPLKAMSWAHQVRELNTKNPQAQELMGDIQLANREIDNALYSYLQWTLLSPNDPAAHYKLGKAQVTAGHPVSARESLQKVLKLKPDFADAAISLGLLAQRDGRHAEAIRHAQQVQRFQPNMWEGFALEGDSHEAQGRHAEAAKAYSRAFALQRSNKLFIRLHQALTKSGQAAQALQLQVAWLKAAPDDLAARLYLGYSQLQAGRSREAQAQFQAALKADAASIPALVGMAAALDAQGNGSGALQYAEQAFQKSGRDAATSDLLGWLLVSRGETKRGLELLRRAESLEPQNPTIRYHLAATLAKTGDTGIARQMLESLLAKDGEFPRRTEAQALLKSLPPIKKGP